MARRGGDRQQPFRVHRLVELRRDGPVERDDDGRDLGGVAVGLEAQDVQCVLRGARPGRGGEQCQQPENARSGES